ncbi:MAG: hypothetical protein ACLR23_20430 [Clostridia bacterium]
MLEHLDQQLTIRQMSQQFHISETFLKSCFRQMYGTPIHQYFLDRRMARQRTCSAPQAKTRSAIAVAVGYGASASLVLRLRPAIKCLLLNSERKEEKVSLFRLFLDFQIPSENGQTNAV